jgi:hypothetical protein
MFSLRYLFQRIAGKVHHAMPIVMTAVQTELWSDVLLLDLETRNLHLDI